MGLLKLIPESSYDKLKSEAYKHVIGFNETRQKFKKSRHEKLNMYEKKLTLIQKQISDKTNKNIAISKRNEANLNGAIEKLKSKIKTDLNSSKYEDNVLFQMESKENIDHDKLNEYELTKLISKTPELEQHLNELSNEVIDYEIEYMFTENKILEDNLLIGEIETV